MNDERNETTDGPTEAPMTPVRALLLFAIVVGFYLAGEIWIAMLGAAVWLFLVVLYGRRGSS